MYAGHGHHFHRLPESKWCSPFIPVIHGSAHEYLLKHADYLTQSDLSASVHELKGKILVCDCSQDIPSPADVLRRELAARAWENHSEKHRQGSDQAMADMARSGRQPSSPSVKTARKLSKKKGCESS